MTKLAAPTFFELAAPSHWRSVEFISDLHLHEQEPANFVALRNYLQTCAADAVFILGDLFEVWVGDDMLQNGMAHSYKTHDDTPTPARLNFEDQCRSVLHTCAQHRPVYFMHGNRDFLLGRVALTACGMQLLPDPTVLTFGATRYLLTHGDALCTADVDYQKFRSQVRSSAWQTEFLAHPLHIRQQMAKDMRAQSEARKQLGGPWIDLDPADTAHWIQSGIADHMVHGHTHEGVDHPIATSRGKGTRHVLCDWHADSVPPRTQMLRLTLVDLNATGSVSVQRLTI